MQAGGAEEEEEDALDETPAEADSESVAAVEGLLSGLALTDSIAAAPGDAAEAAASEAPEQATDAAAPPIASKDAAEKVEVKKAPAGQEGAQAAAAESDLATAAAAKDKDEDEETGRPAERKRASCKGQCSVSQLPQGAGARDLTYQLIRWNHAVPSELQA